MHIGTIGSVKGTFGARSIILCTISIIIGTLGTIGTICTISVTLGH